MADDYIVPLGVDAAGIVKGIDEALGAFDEVEKKAGQAGKTIEEAFGRGSKAADDLDKSMKPTNDSFEELGRTSRKVREDLGKTFDVRKEAAEFSKQVDDVRKRLKEVTDKKKIGLEVDKKAMKDLENALKYIGNNYTEMQNTFDKASKELTKNVSTTQKEIEVLTGNLKDMEAAMKGMAPGKEHAEMLREYKAATQALEEEKAGLEDYERQLQTVNEASKNMSQTINDAKNAFKGFGDTQTPVRRQLLEVRREMQQLELAGQTNTDRFRELSTQAAHLQTNLDLTSKRIRTMADENGMLRATMQGAQGLVGLFSTYNGALALFGVESEEAQKMLLKVNGAMAVLQGTQAVMNVLQKDSALNILILSRLRRQEAADTTTATVATEANTVATRAGTVATRGLGVALKALGIGLVISLVAALVSHWDDMKDAINKVLPAGAKLEGWFDRIKSISLGVGNVILQYIIAPFRALKKVIEGDLKGAVEEMKNRYNVIGNFNEGFRKQEEANEKKHLLNLEKERIEADARDLERRKNRGEDVSQEEIALQKRLLAIQKEGSKEQEEEQRRLEDMEDRQFKVAKDKREAATREATKQSEENRKKRIEAEKKAAEQLAQYTRALEDARISAIEDAGERERAAINKEYERRLNDLRSNVALTLEAQEKQTELEEALIAERDRKISELEKQSLQKQTELRIQAREVLAQLQEESLANDLELLDIDHEQRKQAIEEQYKDEEKLRTDLIEALEASTERERARIRREWGDKERKEQEQRELLLVELSSQYAKQNEETERQKQIAILEIKMEYAQKTLDALLESGEEENSLAVLQAKKTIQGIRKELQEEIEANDGKGFDFLTFIGLGDLDSKQRESVVSAGKQMADNLKQITDFVVSQYDRQIKKKQEVIDQMDGEIRDLERRLEKEKSLQEAGYANNVAILEAELEEKKQLQEEELRQQEELEKKREQMQRAQMAADTAVQLVNMITASSNIFKALSGIPFIGIPLAIATIGTMFGAFVGAKIKAQQAIQQGQQYGEGGWIDGKPHTQGGKKYYSDTGEVRELERGEFVVRERVAKRHGKFLEALNEETLSINDGALRDMLHSLGITFMDESIKTGLDEAKELSTLKHTINVHTVGSAREMKEMNENIRYLARREREKIESWEDEKYIYNKQGSRVTRILKPEFTNNENGTDRE